MDLTQALRMALIELTNTHQDMLHRTQHAPTGCPCTTGGHECCPVKDAIEAGMEALGVDDDQDSITPGLRMQRTR
jgi:hypothetical protein